MEAQIVAAADNADVIAKCIPLENKGSMKASTDNQKWSSYSDANRLTSGITYNSIARTSMGGRRVAEITSHANGPFGEHPRSDEFGEVRREVE